jgi:hypothetical protein
MSMRTSRDQLTRALSDLLLQWERTRGLWRDTRALEFEQRVLDPLRVNVHNAARSMERMAANLQRARSECSSTD